MTWWKYLTRRRRRQLLEEMELRCAEARLAIGVAATKLYITDPQARAELLEELEQAGRDLYQKEQRE